MRRFNGFVRARTGLALIIGLLVALITGGGTAYALTAASPAPAPTAAPATSLYACVAYSNVTHTRLLEAPFTGLAGYLAYLAANGGKCPNGGFEDTLASGANGVSVTGASVNASGDLILTFSNGTSKDAGHVAGTNGTNGAPGSNGTPGASAVTNVTAATQLSNWPDTGGAGDVWALDNWTRTLSVTVEDQVNNSHCGGAPACYAVFGTITDNGTSVPQDGKAAPNNSKPATIAAADITQITSGGTASFQFYATSDAINAKNVPAVDNVAVQGKLASTTDWGELAFPAGTQFFGPSLTAYSWNYSAALSYVNPSKTAVSCNQAWADAINPGDDGQGAADGNITGTCAT